MGREIRKVPANWDHPITQRPNGREGLQPMYDHTFEGAAEEWLAEFDRIRSGNLTDFERKYYTGPFGVVRWLHDDPGPDPEYCRPWSDAEATWFQVWETVSEGTPVSPPFETEAELIDYLAENGDAWDQTRCKSPNWTTLWGGKLGVSGWGKERAERFVKGPGWAPSIVIENGVAKSGVAAVTGT